MYDNFQLAAGTIVGRRHVGSGNLLVGKNNQDAYGVSVGRNCVVAAVFDGCSSSDHSEVGAKAAARIVPDMVRACAEQIDLDIEKLVSPDFWRDVKKNVLSRLAVMVRAMSPLSRLDEGIVADHFLFTILGALITDKCTIIFSVGDGVYAIDGVIHRIGPFADNAPPYLCYELMRSYEGEAVSFHIQQVHTGPCDSVLVATDGLLHLFGREHHRVPGRASLIGPLSDLWTNEFFFADGCEETITPWLRRLNSEVVNLHQADGAPRIHRDYGLLGDDTTLVAVRRKRGC